MNAQIAALLSVATCAGALAVAAPAATGPAATNAGVVRSAAPAPSAEPAAIDRTFHPDYSRALTPEQMQRAWNAEIDRVFQTPVTGGG